MSEVGEQAIGLPRDFEGWWQAAGDWVEAPNQRRGGWSGMIRHRCGERIYYVKRQCNFLCRSPRHPLGWPTVAREYENIRRLAALGLNVPKPVFFGSRKSAEGFEGVLVTEELAGFADLHSQTGLEPAAVRSLAVEVGRMLGVMHRASLQHGCLYDNHIMVRWQGDQPVVALIDLEKLRKTLFSRRAVARDLRQFKRRQRVFDETAWAGMIAAHDAVMRAA
jgi:tRNA A-37 threonylcarbamoyl transferase component Bud32